MAISSAGLLYALNPQTGEDVSPPIPFLPAGSNATGAILLNDNRVIVATTGQCGGADAVYAVATIGDDHHVTSWTAGGAAIAGTAGPAFSADGATIYVATGAGRGTSDAVVALDAGTLAVRGTFKASTPFTSSPTVFEEDGTELVAVTNADGRLYLLDGTNLGGMPVTSAAYAAGPFEAGAITTWQDASETRWIVVPSGGALASTAGVPAANGTITHGTLVAFKVTMQNGRPSLQAAWASRDLTSPVAPLVMNGVVFGLSTGEYRGADAATTADRVRRSTPAVLVALDGATGRTLWDSGSSLTSFVHGVPPSGGDGQIYVSAHDGTIYAFGMPTER
jgi:hypothetical protein